MPGDIPSNEEISREAKRRLRELLRKMGAEHRDHPGDHPGAGEELWPGGPSVDTGDIRLASRRRKKGHRGLA